MVVVTISSRRRFELLYLLHNILYIHFDLKLSCPLIVYLHLRTTYSIPGAQHDLPDFGVEGMCLAVHFQMDIIKTPLAFTWKVSSRRETINFAC